MFEVSVKMIIMSQLSDVQCTVDKVNNVRINYVKYLILTYPNTNTLVFPDDVYNDFEKKFPYLTK